MNWFKIAALITSIAFVMLGTYTLLRMNESNDYMFCWIERVRVIRITEVVLGLFTSVYMLKFLIETIIEEVKKHEESELDKAFAWHRDYLAGK